MPDRRIKVPADKMDVINRLVASEETTGPFRLQADVMAFAAAVGALLDRDKQFTDSSKEPIRHEVFERHGYGTMMGMLAITKEKDPVVLADDEVNEERRAVIFESYANAGLEFLREELKGSVDDTETLLMLLNRERQQAKDVDGDDFDLRSMLQ